MDIVNLLFNVNGRIGQREFWTGVVILVVGNILISVIPVLGVLIWLVLVWVGIAVYGKRLHDVGKSAWFHAIPWAVTLLLSLDALIMTVNAIMGATSRGSESVILASSGMMGPLFFLGNLVWLGYTLWVGLMDSELGENAYGQAP